MTDRPTDSPTPVLVVAGMHRSGTSFLASALHRAGCAMGDDLLPADSHNRRGYFEDIEFLELNRRMLAATTAADSPGHPDWGWTERVDAAPSEGDLEAFVADADALVTRHRRAATDRGVRCWGWKDPRTSVLLDFWNARVPDARYVFVYRAPWDVANSMQRLCADLFLERPDFAYRIWHHYNRELLAFARRHRDRTVLVHASALVRDPGSLIELLRARFGIELDAGATGSVAEPALMMAAAPGVAALASVVHPECHELLATLESFADLPLGEPLPVPRIAPSAAERPQVTIVIPCFNDGEYLVDAIASVERTVAAPYELLIVNDGSRDLHTLGLLDRLRRAGYRVIDQENEGLARARNRGIAEAGAEIVLPLDADNQLLPQFVDAALEVLARSPSVMGVYGDRRESGLRSGRVAVGVPDLDRLLCGNYIDACAVIRREAWRACGGYDATMPAQGMEDWDLWLSMLERGFTLHRLDMETFDYRVRPGSMLSRTQAPDVRASLERYVLAKHASFYLQELRRHVDRLETLSSRVAEMESQETDRRRPWLSRVLARLRGR